MTFYKLQSLRNPGNHRIHILASSSCDETFFSCGGNTSYCIPWPGVCDTDPDCSDGSDESVEFCKNVGESGSNFTTINGLLTSPSYPDNYPSDTDCSYTISQPTGTYLNLTFRMFDLDSCFKTVHDYLEIRDGSSEASPLIGKFCGTDVPASIHTTQNQVWMK